MSGEREDSRFGGVHDTHAPRVGTYVLIRGWSRISVARPLPTPPTPVFNTNGNK